jgi:hypothetical protein
LPWNGAVASVKPIGPAIGIATGGARIQRIWAGIHAMVTGRVFGQKPSGQIGQQATGDTMYG